MEKIEKLIQKNTLRDVELELKKAQLNGAIIPDLVYEIVHEVEDSYRPTEDELEKEFDVLYSQGKVALGVLDDDLPDYRDNWIAKRIT